MSPSDNESFQTALEHVRGLIADFEANEPAFLAPEYSEQAARKDFIDKFFTALGWDVDHSIQKNPYQQEVKIEHSVQTGASKRRADYSFAIAPHFHAARFLVEAKKPQAHIGTADNYFQAIRYAWNKQTPLVVLTDFYSFHILDSRFQPDITTAVNRLLKQFNYHDLKEGARFAEAYFLFSRDAVKHEAITTYAQTLPKPTTKSKQYTLFKGGYQHLDETFLAQLDEYRTTLARSFKKTNPSLDGPTLTELVQRTLDRLVFLRFLEDKLIEATPRMHKFGQNNTPWRDFIAASRRLDGIYNGIVFKHHSILDAASFQVDEHVFGELCDSLSNPNSPYDFDSISVSILGSIYERFLGQVITVSDGAAQVVDKPEVRKAGGVFYTPEEIVRYIVAGTVGKLIDGKTPEAISKMRFADIACGSGSFLIAVFDFLLRYHETYYHANPGKAKKGDTVERDSVTRLTLKKKREILLTNCFGVDIDHQAVEVAQLSLYLKLLENETLATASFYQHEIHETLLPPLNANIVCGNSLLDSDTVQASLFEVSDSDDRRINAMTFRDVFPVTMKAGGFDAIVGNPPYVRIQVMKEWAPIEVAIIKERYRSAAHGNYDIYVAFIERALNLLKPSGRLGYIVPNKFLNSKYGQCLRNLIFEGRHLQQIVHFGDQQVFEGATTYTCLLFLAKDRVKQFTFRRVDNLKEWYESKSATEGQLSTAAYGPHEWNLVVGRDDALYKTLAAVAPKLGDVADIYVGLQTSTDAVFIVRGIEETSNYLTFQSKSLGKVVKAERALFHPLVSGTDIARYGDLPSRQYILFPYERTSTGMFLIASATLRNNYPLTSHYLFANKTVLQQREGGAFKDSEWYRFGRNQNIDKQDRVKICVPRLVERLRATMDSTGAHFLDNVDVGGVTVKPTTSGLDLYYLLGLLNSNLMAWYFPFVSAPFRGGFRSANRQFLGQLPIRVAKASAKSDRARCERVADLVQKQLAATAKTAAALSDKDRQYYGAKCVALDRQIDELVYELYGLSNKAILALEEHAEATPVQTAGADA